MRISVKKAQTGIYSVSFNDTTHTLTTHDLKVLLMEAVKSLTPGAVSSVTPQQEAIDLAERLKSASNAGLQRMIVRANDEDLLLFLKVTEDDAEFQSKMFSNMSARNQKIFAEDLSFKITGDIDEDRLAAAMIHLIEQVNKMQNEGAFNEPSDIPEPLDDDEL